MRSGYSHNDSFDALYARGTVPMCERGASGINWRRVLQSAAELSVTRVVGDTICVPIMDIEDFLQSGINWSVSDAVSRSVSLSEIKTDIELLSELAGECMFFGGKLVVSNDQKTLCCEWLPRETIYIGGDCWLLVDDHSKWGEDGLDSPDAEYVTF